MFDGSGRQLVDIAGRDVPTLGKLLDAGVPRRAVDGVDRITVGEAPNESVFAAAPADYEYIHRKQSEIG